jgi:hypothetical protein
MIDTTTLEQQIGAPPGDEAAFSITPANRELVREWLIAKGFDAGRAASAREGTLYKAYSIPSYLRALLQRGDYNPSIARKTEEPAEMPKPANGHAAPVRLGLAEQIAAMIQEAAPQGVTEQQVIALIQKHVPAIVRQVLSEAMASVAVNLDME